MVPSIVPALVARSRRRIVDDLQSRGATTLATAVAYTPEDRLITRRVFRRMCEAGAVIEAEPGRFYLDHAVLQTYRSSLRKRVGLVAGAAAVTLFMGPSLKTDRPAP